MGTPRYARPSGRLCAPLSERTEIVAQRFIGWLGVTSSKFCDWRGRYGKANEHNGWIPRDFWLQEWEKRNRAEG